MFMLSLFFLALALALLVPYTRVNLTQKFPQLEDLARRRLFLIGIIVLLGYGVLDKIREAIVGKLAYEMLLAFTNNSANNASEKKAVISAPAKTQSEVEIPQTVLMSSLTSADLLKGVFGKPDYKKTLMKCAETYSQAYPSDFRSGWLEVHTAKDKDESYIIAAITFVREDSLGIDLGKSFSNKIIREEKKPYYDGTTKNLLYEMYWKNGINGNLRVRDLMEKSKLNFIWEEEKIEYELNRSELALMTQIGVSPKESDLVKRYDYQCSQTLDDAEIKRLKESLALKLASLQKSIDAAKALAVPPKNKI